MNSSSNYREETKMAPRPQSKALSPRRAARMRSRVLFFLLRRSVRRLQGSTKARVSRVISRIFQHGPRPLRLEP
jgi:hypothetical protein